MTTSWREAPFTVHVDASAPVLAEQARAAGATVIRVPLAGLHTTEQLCDRLAQVFEFPFPSSGLDGALDMVSDLEWLELGRDRRGPGGPGHGQRRPGRGGVAALGPAGRRCSARRHRLAVRTSGTPTRATASRR